MAMPEMEASIRARALQWAKNHRKAIARRFTDPSVYPPEDCPVSIFMAGSPGAGKTEASKALIKQVGGAVLRIDPDDLRDQFSEYNGRNSWLFQGAVSRLVERILDDAFRQRQSFLLDGTFAQFDKAEKNIQRSLQRKRMVQILYVYQDPAQAWAFVQARESQEGRRIACDVFIDQYFKARKVVNRLKKAFGSHIQVDLLLKNIDGSNRLLRINIDQIDSYAPEKYDSDMLRQLLSP